MYEWLKSLILKVLVRKTTLLSIIFLFSVAFLRELAAISAGSNWDAVISYIDENHPEYSLVGLLISALTVGGNIVVAFILGVCLFGLLYAYFVDKARIPVRPRLDIQLKRRGGSKRPLGISDNSPFELIDGRRVFDISRNKAIYYNEIKLMFTLLITNSSSFPAFYPVMKIEGAKKHNVFVKEKNIYKPIPPFESREIPFTYTYIIEMDGAAASTLTVKPPQDAGFDDMIIIVEYENELKTKFESKLALINVN